MNKKNSNESNVPTAAMRNLVELYRDGSYKETEMLASSLIEKFPKNIKLYQILGSTLRKSGRFKIVT